MDEEDKQLLKQLSAIMQQIEQKGLLKVINAEQQNELLSDVNENKVGGENGIEIWKPLSIGIDGLPFHRNDVGGSVVYGLKMHPKKGTEDLFGKIYPVLRRHEAVGRIRQRNADDKSGKNYEAVGLIRVDDFMGAESALSPKPLPKSTLENTGKGTYIMCRIFLGCNKSGNYYLNLYVSKEWSRIIKKKFPKKKGARNDMKITDLWVLNNNDNNLMLPCKVICRWSAHELVVNVPSWLPLVGKITGETITNIWARHYDTEHGRFTKGYLTKKSTQSHYRCARKKPWNFYLEMHRKMKNPSDKMPVDLMIAFTPEAIFQE